MVLQCCFSYTYFMSSYYVAMVVPWWVSYISCILRCVSMLFLCCSHDVSIVFLFCFVYSVSILLHNVSNMFFIVFLLCFFCVCIMLLWCFYGAPCHESILVCLICLCVSSQFGRRFCNVSSCFFYVSLIFPLCFYGASMFLLLCFFSVSLLFLFCFDDVFVVLLL